MKELLQPEVLFQAKELIWLASIMTPAFLMAFSARQRENILDRDEHKCQFPARHRCNGKSRLEVHHVIPQRYAREVLNIDPDYEDNGITLCEHSHQTMVHPDMVEAKKTYHEKKKKGIDSYKEAFKKRGELLQQRQIYWNSTWDRLFNAIVQKNKAKQQRRK